MRFLIAILSCHADERNGNNAAARNTWITNCGGVDYRFFVGSGGEDIAYGPDTVRLPVSDDYESLPHKTRGAAAFALEHGYDFMYKCDRDTYVVPGRLLSSGFEQYDYFGHFPGHPVEETRLYTPDDAGHYGYASGGCGYVLSRRALEIVARTEVTDWAEDRWVGDTMGRNGIPGRHDMRLWFKFAETLEPSTISCHLSQGPGNYSRDHMTQMHRRFVQCGSR